MFKYLAVIKDSFREAFASRLMWVVLVLITLLLLVIAPLGYYEVVTWRLGDGDVRDWLQFTDTIRDQANETVPSPPQRIWSLLDAELQADLKKVKLPGVDPEAIGFGFVGVMGRFQKAVNQMLERRDFYDEKSFAKVTPLPSELQELRKNGLDKLSDIELKRFNRLLVEAAFPDRIRESPPTSLQITYLWSDVFDPVPFRGSSLRQRIQDSASWVIGFFVGAIGIMVAVLITAPTIPQMFDAGALHLLLSKPISRWLLFLARFFGGCAFILIGATYLIGGLWLILGIRFGVWDPKLLLSIPIYLFVFAIYYSVSSLVGAIYRSPIVAIMLTVVFWGACSLMGLIKTTFEAAVWEKLRLVKVFEAGDSLIAVNELGIAHEWDADKREWREIFLSQEQQAVRGMLLFVSPLSSVLGGPIIPQEVVTLGPAYDEAHSRLVAGQPAFQPSGRVVLKVGGRDNKWEPEGTTNVPMGTRELLTEPSGTVLLVSNLGLYRLTGDPLKKDEPVKIFGFTLPLPPSGPFTTVNPAEPVLLTQPSDAALNSASGELALYTRGKLLLLKTQDDGRYERVAEKDLETKKPQAVVLGFGGNTLVLARADGEVLVLDSATLETREQFTPEGKNQPRFVTASPDGRWFAIVFHNRRLWLYDAQSQHIHAPGVAGQGDIASAGFTRDNKLLVTHKMFHINQYDPSTLSLESRFVPRLNAVTIAYRYVILPVYTIFPKPGELHKTFQFFLTGKVTTADSDDLASAQTSLNPWTPLWSSALFVVVILAATCIYIERQEF